MRNSNDNAFQDSFLICVVFATINFGQHKIDDLKVSRFIILEQAVLQGHLINGT